MAYDLNNRYATIIRNSVPAFRVYEDKHMLAFLETNPQAIGHTVVVPKTRAESIFDIPSEWFGHLARTTQVVATAIQMAFNPDGIKLVQPNLPAAGQTVRHVHFQIIPCYKRSPNAESVAAEIADTSKLLEHAERIRRALTELRAKHEKKSSQPPGPDFK